MAQQSQDPQTRILVGRQEVPRLSRSASRPRLSLAYRSPGTEKELRCRKLKRVSNGLVEHVFDLIPNWVDLATDLGTHKDRRNLANLSPAARQCMMLLIRNS